MTSSPHYVDLAFPARGQEFPLDHGYLLFAALSRLVPAIHQGRRWGVHPLFGKKLGARLAIQQQSRVKIRMPSEDIPLALGLTGATLDVGGAKLTLSPPKIFPLEPAAMLKARYVSIKGFEDAEAFSLAARRQLAEIPDLGQDPQQIELLVGSRRVITIKDRRVVGFAVGVDGLTSDASMALQIAGLGGRRHLGGGIFVPLGRYRS